MNLIYACKIHGTSVWNEAEFNLAEFLFIYKCCSARVTMGK